MSTELFIDICLVSGTVILAGLSLLARELFAAIVLYVSVGLLVTLIWVRLNAWDVAIAEAAIGAGLTGALLLVGWRQLSTESINIRTTSHDDSLEETDHVS